MALKKSNNLLKKHVCELQKKCCKEKTKTLQLGRFGLIKTERRFMNVAFVNPFIISTIETFKKMLHVDVKPGKPSLKHEGDPVYDISGIIGLSGIAQGAISISFPKIVALKAVSAMLGSEVKIIGPEMTDGIGEIVNIIAGNAKQYLTQFHLTISLPNVIVGKNHSITAPSNTPSIVVPFNGAIGAFAMEVSLKTPDPK
jgi:chemotaxis protein CheX